MNIEDLKCCGNCTWKMHCYEDSDGNFIDKIINDFEKKCNNWTFDNLTDDERNFR